MEIEQNLFRFRGTCLITKNFILDNRFQTKKKEMQIVLRAEIQIIKCSHRKPSLMAAILVFYTYFQVAPYLKSHLLASIITTESGIFIGNGKSAAFYILSDGCIQRTTKTVHIS